MSMANNRLYIYDEETHEIILLAKSFGTGWTMDDDRINKIRQWLNLKDIEGSYNGSKTSLRLIAENDPEFYKIKK